MLPPGSPQVRIAAPVALGDRLLVPVVRLLALAHEQGGMGSCLPVALLVREGSAWSFVPLEEGIGQEILAGLDPSSPAC